jgi:hypothetical protein
MPPPGNHRHASSERRKERSIVQGWVSQSGPWSMSSRERVPCSIFNDHKQKRTKEKINDTDNQ